MEALAIRGVEVRFGDRAVLRDVSLSVAPGCVVGVSGANGAGKSTLLRVAAGLLRPGRGSVRITGMPPERARRAARIGWSAPGEGGFTRRVSLRANLELAGAMADLPRRALRVRIESLADRLGFRDHLDVPAERCSSGMRQRAALARALLHQPPVLLLDEPLRGVDAPSAAGLARDLRAGWRTEAVVWVSHAPQELELVADRILRLERGALRAHPRARSAA